MPHAAQPLRSVSVLLPTWQGAEFLDRLLTSLARQRLELPWDVLAIDSGSTDGTCEILAGHAAGFPVPLSVRGIDQVEFDHGDTRNLLAALSSGDLLVFLTQDAIPLGDDWLARVVRNFDTPDVAAVTCRNVPRADADPVTRLLSDGDPGYVAGRRETRLPPAEEYERLDPHARRLLYGFNDVASAIRREVWELHPFPRTWFGEDVLMARALLEGGWTVVYDDDACVEHSHDYDVDQTYGRAFVDGRFNAEWLDRVAVASSADADALARRFRAEDSHAVRAAGYGGDEALRLEERAAALRLAAFHGLADGGRTAARQPGTGMLASSALRVLFVVHGFPPDTWAGTEVYTLNLARELQRRGHEVTVFARVPAGDEGEADFDVRESTFEGLRVLRMTNRLAHRSLRESYEDERAEEAFRLVLLAERPDVVHFQHLIHTSVGLVDIARRLGLATVMHCHDYWALCPRVQLIRPDGERCPENMGAGCYACVKERALPWIPTLKRAGEVGGEPLVELLDLLGRKDFRELDGRLARVTAAYASCDLQVSPSRFLRLKLLETGRFDPHRFLYSDNGMRTDHVQALTKTPRAGGRLRVGFVGSLVWYKGGEVLVRAMCRLAGEPAELHVHGDFRPDADEHHRELERIAQEGKAPVVFHGRFDNSRLSEVYADIDVLVVPSLWYENSPITIHEAFLTRTPVVTSGIGGMAEYVRDGVDGLHFRTGDEADLAACLRRLIEEPELLAQLSRDFIPIKTIAEDAAATEFRYRGLLARRRSREEATLLDASGASADRREGPVDDQAGELVLLRPGGAAVEFELAGPPVGPVEVRVDVQALGGEDAVELGGRILLGGVELGPIDPFRAGEDDEVRSFSYTTEAPTAGALRIESALSRGGAEAHLRIRRVFVRETGREVGA
ncbi:MAG: glycosyltransferase [Planctomycetota bacterium]